MKVKYYGFSDEGGAVVDYYNGIAHWLNCDVIYGIRPSACVWLVPGTFDVNDKDVGETE